MLIHKRKCLDRSFKCYSCDIGLLNISYDPHDSDDPAVKNRERIEIERGLLRWCLFKPVNYEPIKTQEILKGTVELLVMIETGMNQLDLATTKYQPYKSSMLT